MSNLLVTHGGGTPEGYDVATTGTRIAVRDPLRKFLAITNASEEVVYLALSVGSTNKAVVGRGIYLAPNGGAFELNNSNMYYGDVWAIHGAVGVQRVCVQTGK